MIRRSKWQAAAAVATVFLLRVPAHAQTPGAGTATPTATVAAPATGGTITGTVKAETTPLPGVAITATNTLTGTKYATTTDVDGSFAMTIPKTGRYVVRAELAAFAPLTREVRLTAEAAAGTAEFALELASRAAAQQAAAGQQTAQRAIQQLAAGLGRGTQALSVGGEAGLQDATAGGGGNAAAGLPSMAGIGGEASGADSSDAVAVSGQQGITNPLAGLNEDQIRSRVEDAVQQARQRGGGEGDQINAVVGMLGGIIGGGGFGGGPGGFGGGGGRGGRGGPGGGGGGFRNFNPAQPHGAVFYQGGNSALNSAPWSPTLQPIHNPSAYSNRFGVSLLGSPYLPGLTKPDTRQFAFINLTGQKNLNAFLPNPVRVPTALERTGDFSQSFQEVNGALVPVTIFNPATGQPFVGNRIPNCTAALNPGCSAQALKLLSYYPAPNINVDSTDPTVYNFQTVSNAGSNNIAINTRYQRQLGQQTGSAQRGEGGGGRGQQSGPAVLRQNINASYNYSHAASDNRNIFLPLGGANSSDGNGLNVGYTVSYGRLNNNASLNWNRSSGEARNYFTDSTFNPSADAQICVPNGSSNSNCGAISATNSDPRFYYGLPSVSITNFAGLGNQTPNKTVNQTISFSDFVAWRHKRHNYRFGFDYRRVHADSIGGNNPLGQFSFTGYATESVADQTSASATGASGSGFADFLLGAPTSTRIQAGLSKIYLRENVFDLFATDDFRTRANFTFNYSVRYDFFGPYTEKNNRLANLDHNPDFSKVDVVMPGASGAYGGGYPAALVNPDRTLFSPRVGVAWQPRFKWSKNTVVRGGYGINYNTGQYATFARQLSFQPPFAQTQTNAIALRTGTASGCTLGNLSLANGFGTTAPYSGCSTQNPIHNSFAVDKNYRLGLLQAYNLNIQKTFKLGLVLNVGYNGSHGSNLDVEGSPNSSPQGNLLQGLAAPFLYETSSAASRSNQLVVSLQQRQHKGVALGVTYQYSHAIDNASSIGGTSATTVQNFYRLDLEESNSGFDQRHLLTGNYLIELPFGPNREFLNKGGLMAKILDGFSISGNFNFGSGNYFTPQYQGNAAEASSGNDYTQRPNRVFSQSIAGSGRLRSYFNAAAFTAPTVLNGITQYGTASRNSIEGPGSVSVNTSLSRTVALGGTNSFEARVTATNVFNTVQYNGINTVVNSQTYGQVTSAAQMRHMEVQARYRF